VELAILYTGDILGEELLLSTGPSIATSTTVLTPLASSSEIGSQHTKFDHLSKITTNAPLVVILNNDGCVIFHFCRVQRTLI
jgi:hypothetical protein